MKKRIRVNIFLVSYLISYFGVVGLLTLISRVTTGSETFTLHQLVFYLGCTVLAIPLTFTLIAPSLRALYYRVVRRNRASQTMSRKVRRIGGNIISSGASVFMLKDDEALTVTSASPGFWHLIGKPSHGTRNRTLSLTSIIHPDDVQKVQQAILGSDVAIPQTDFRILVADGEVKWLRLFGIKEEIAHSGFIVSNCMAMDITEFLINNRQLEVDRQHYQQLLNNLGSGVWEYHADRDEMYLLNRHMEDGIPQLVRNFRTAPINSGIIHPDFVDTYKELCQQFTDNAELISAEIYMRNHSGNYRWYSVTGRAVKDETGAIVSYIGQITATTPSAAGRNTVNPDDFDALTRLNRRYAFESLVNERLRLRSRHAKGALFVINVDNFNRINTSLGRLFGDALLIELSEALRNIFPKNSILSRISGDEFAVYTDNYPSEEYLFALAGSVCDCVRHCYINTEQTESVTCCVGLSLYPTHGNRFEQLFFKADSALVYAKHRGPGNYYVYSPDLDRLLSDISVSHTHEDPASLPAASPSFRDDSLLSQAVDILFDSRELSSSINLIISLLGRRFKLDRAYVLEFSGDMEHGTITYAWHSERAPGGDCKNMILPIAEAREHVMCATRDEYFLCNDMPSYVSEHPQIATLNEEFGVKAMIQCPIVDGSDLLGCFAYAICREGSVFTESDVSQILMITKIIIGYLVRLRSKQDIDRITYRDKLTGVMNFTAFQLEFERILASNPQCKYAIVYSDIDRFKFINEKYGFRAGDNILRAISDIYRKKLDPDEIFARVTADKFIAIMKYSSQLELDQRINAIHDAINHIQKTDNTCYYLPVRSGVYHIRPEDTSISGMIDLANLARKSVKNIHISTISHFNESMKSRLKRQKDIEQVMADALVREEFVVFYQPKFALCNNRLAGAEALVRWKRPDAALMRPDEFIPIFEDNGFIIELDFYVLEQVCRKLRRDIDNNVPVLPISVNFSRTHIKSEDLITRLHDCLQRYNIPPNLIEIEITESALTENEGYLIDMISELHNIGLVVSMDDFGSGFSSLNLLKKLPVDILKIDKNFFASDSATERERCIIENVVNMARSLGIHVVSEGVETSEQANFLRSIKCDLAQGYLFGPPVDERSFEMTYQAVWGADFSK